MKTGKTPGEEIGAVLKMNTSEPKLDRARMYDHMQRWYALLVCFGGCDCCFVGVRCVLGLCEGKCK